MSELGTRPLFDDETMANIEEKDEESNPMSGDAPRVQPNLNEWAAVYEAAKSLHDLAPWQWMFEDQMFAVEDPDSGEVGYCSVMGSGGEFLALAVYPGEKGLRSYQRLSGQNAEPGTVRDPDVYLSQRALMASFEGSSDVDKRDREVFQSLGLRFRGKQAWPVLRSYEAGYVRWFLSAEECRLLTHALEQATLIGQRMKDDPTLLEQKPGSVLTRVLIREGNADKWMDEWREWPHLEDEADNDLLPPVSQVSEIRLKRVLKQAEASGAWEVDISYAPFSVWEGERPYFPRLMLCVHYGSGTILAAYPGELSVDSSEFVNQFVATMEQHGLYPEQVVVSRKSVGRLLSSVAQAIGAEVIDVDYLPGVAKAREGMEEFMG